MHDKILELCSRYRKHNTTINVSIYPYKSTVFIDLQGETIAHDKESNTYKRLSSKRLVTDTDLEKYDIDILEYEMNDIFSKLLQMRKEIEE